MQRFNRFYLLVVFGLMLVAPFLNDRFHFVEFKRFNENRKYHDSLSININKLDKFPKDCELYLKDNFAFRTPMIRWAKSIKIDWFGISPDPERLIIGKNGRFFIAGKERENYEGLRRFTPQQLDSFEGEWLRRKRYLNAKGIPFHLILAPSALEVYPEELPINIVKQYPDSREDQLCARLNKRLPGMIIDPKPAFKKAKEKHNLYFRLDNHWNARAGMVVSRIILERLKKEKFHELDLSFLDRYTWKTQDLNSGYLGTLMPSKELSELIPIPVNRNIQSEPAEKYGFPVLPYFMYPQDYEMRFVHKNPKNKLKLLIIRDSGCGAVCNV
jgi:alginate O-acetyltransferase complex protein AlgJ